MSAVGTFPIGANPPAPTAGIGTVTNEHLASSTAPAASVLQVWEELNAFLIRFIDLPVLVYEDKSRKTARLWIVGTVIGCPMDSGGKSNMTECELADRLLPVPA